MKRFLSLLTVGALIVSMLAVYPAAETASTLTKTDGKYVISTKEELLLFSCLVNGIEGYEGIGEPDADAVLAADITYNVGVIDAEGNLNQAAQKIDPWVPIGAVYGDREVVYTGTFDGAGHTVSGLYSNSDQALRVGMFGCIGEGAVVKDLNITGSYIDGPDMVGGVAGESRGGAVVNCTVSHGKVIADLADNGVGGIVGYSTGRIESCDNSADVFTLDGYCGGIVGKTLRTVAYSQNSGEITSVMGSAAGIAAEAEYIEKCINFGSVNGIYATAGIVGKLHERIGNSLNYGKLFIDVTDPDYYGGGELVGVFGKGILENCYYTDNGLDAVGCDENGNPMTSNAVKVTEEQLTSGEISNKLGYGVGQTLDGVTKPTFGGETVYRVKISVDGIGSVNATVLGEYVNPEVKAVVTDDAYVFRGWYEGNRKLITTEAEWTVNKDMNILVAKFAPLGDANCDKKFNSKDIILYKLAVNGVNTGVDDLTGDGLITIDDVNAVCQLVYGG